MDRRAELQGWIADTRRRQQRMAYVFGALVALAFVLWLWQGRIGALALFFVALVGVISYWVTAAHNAAHRQKLTELERLERMPPPGPAAHRRWGRAT